MECVEGNNGMSQLEAKGRHQSKVAAPLCGPGHVPDAPPRARSAAEAQHGPEQMGQTNTSKS